MTQAIFIFQAKTPRDERLAKLISFIKKLPADKPWQVTIDRYKKQRSNGQNAYLWMTYQNILNNASEELRGWTRDDLHDFFLIDHFGHEEISGFGRKRIRPLQRSSKLSTTEFMDFVAHIQQFMAERGMYLPDPNEEYQE